MKHTSYSLLLFMILLSACDKNTINNIPNTPAPTNSTSAFDPAQTSGVLKDATDIPLGMAISYEEFKNNGANYLNIVKSEFDNITFGYHMKHGAVVKSDGSLDFTRTDELFSGFGMPTFGHVLAWHQNNNGDYLRSLEGSSTTNPSGKNILDNGDFETGTASAFTNWTNLVGGTAEGSFGEETKDTEPSTGSKRALKATVTKAGTNAWDMQSLGPTLTVNSGKMYRISVAVKSVSGGGKFKLILQKNNYLESQLTFSNSSWKTFIWEVAINESNPDFKLHFNGEGTYLIDNIRVEELITTTQNAAESAKKIDLALKTWVQGILTKYKTVKAWDAINEVYTDGLPTIRTGSSTGDTYYWATFLGRSYIAKTFTYAREVCPDCEFFINDYNLEYNPAKLDSTIALAKELIAQKIPVAGIGTQMHININTSQTLITDMFKKLAATGLKVRVSELDVRANPNDASDFSFTQTISDKQAQMYQFVVQEYIKNVPAAQRHGITVWGVSDKDSWIVTVQKKNDFPLMYDKDFKKKPAYTGFWRGLKGL